MIAIIYISKNGQDLGEIRTPATAGEVLSWAVMV
jgi:hypothetical protein